MTSPVPSQNITAKLASQRTPMSELMTACVDWRASRRSTVSVVPIAANTNASGNDAQTSSVPAPASATSQRVAQLEAGVAAGRPQQHDHRHLGGADEDFGFEVGLGDLDAAGGGTAR